MFITSRIRKENAPFSAFRLVLASAQYRLAFE